VVPSCQALQPNVQRLKRIVDLLANGYTVEQLELAIGAYEAEAKVRPEHRLKYLNGDGNWRPANVDRALGQLGDDGPTVGEQTEAARVLTRLGERTGHGWTEDKHAVRTVVARLRGGLSADELWAIARYCASPPPGLGWAEDERMRPHLNPSTLFSPESVAKHLTAAKSYAARARS
jgi:hypothetical protein